MKKSEAFMWLTPESSKTSKQVKVEKLALDNNIVEDAVRLQHLLACSYLMLTFLQYEKGEDEEKLPQECIEPTELRKEYQKQIQVFYSVTENKDEKFDETLADEPEAGQSNDDKLFLTAERKSSKISFSEEEIAHKEWLKLNQSDTVEVVYERSRKPKKELPLELKEISTNIETETSNKHDIQLGTDTKKHQIAKKEIERIPVQIPMPTEVETVESTYDIDTEMQKKQEQGVDEKSEIKSGSLIQKKSKLMWLCVGPDIIRKVKKPSSSQKSREEIQELEKEIDTSTFFTTKVKLNFEEECHQTKDFEGKPDILSVEKRVSSKKTCLDETAEHPEFDNTTKPCKVALNVDATKTDDNFTEIEAISTKPSRRQRVKKDVETLPFRCSRSEVIINRSNITSVPNPYLENIFSEFKDFSEQDIEEMLKKYSYDTENLDARYKEVRSDSYLLSPAQLQGLPFQIAQEAYLQDKLEEAISHQDPDAQETLRKAASDRVIHAMKSDSDRGSNQSEHKDRTIETEIVQDIQTTITNVAFTVFKGFQNYVLTPITGVVDQFLGTPRYNEERYRTVRESLRNNTIVYPVMTQSRKWSTEKFPELKATELGDRLHAVTSRIRFEIYNEDPDRDKASQTTKDLNPETIGVYSKPDNVEDVLLQLNLKTPDEVLRELQNKTCEVEMQQLKDMPFSRTGLFSDGIRRVDYVLVIASKKVTKAVQDIQIDFLVGLVKLGIQIESVAGTLPQHKQLRFLKLHATDAFLNTYAEALGVKKYYQEAHEDLIQFNESLTDHVFQQKYEKELLQMVRKMNNGTLNMSTIDRSYTLLLVLKQKTFGRPQNYFGLDRLIQNGIIIDGYAMHDGPDKPFSGQKTAFNNRQILDMTWYNGLNILRKQPSHLVHEYFGPKLSLLFIFYEFYNWALVIASIWGILVTLLYFEYTDTVDGAYMSFLRERLSKQPDPKSTWGAPDMDSQAKYYNFICAECEGEPTRLLCPYTLLVEYGFDIKFMSLYDNNYIIMYSLGICGSAILFLSQWHRIVSYWKWVWEESMDSQPEPRRNEGTIKKTSGEKIRACFVMFYTRAIIPGIAIFLLVLLIFVVFIVLYEYGRKISVKERPKKDNIQGPPIINRRLEYFVLAVEIIGLNVISCAIEYFYHSMAVGLTQMENHSFQTTFLEELCAKIFSSSFIFASSFIIYFAFVKDALYYTPTHGYNLTYDIFGQRYYLRDILSESLVTICRRAISMNCGPFSCIRQASMVFIATVIFRVLIVGILKGIRRWISMYNLDKMLQDKNVPTIEKEFMLQEITELDVYKEFSHLFVQFGLFVLFLPLFPLATILPLIFNIWDIRSKKNFYLRYARRPVLYRGVRNLWNSLKTVCYLAPLIHAMIMVRTEAFKYPIFKFHYDEHFGVATPWSLQLNLRFFESKHRGANNIFNNYMRLNFLHNFFLGSKHLKYDNFTDLNVKERVYVNDTQTNKYGIVANTKQYFLNGCRFNGYFESTRGRTRDPWPYQWDYMEDNCSRTAPRPEHYQLKAYGIMFIITYMVFFMLFAAAVYQYMGRCWPSVARQRCREANLKRMQHNQMRFMRDGTFKTAVVDKDSTSIIYKMMR